MSTTVSTVGTSLRDRIAAKRKDIKQKSGMRADVIKVQPGKHKYRILPTHPDLGGVDADFWVDFGQHFVKDEAGKTKAVYVCVDKTFGRPCPVCAALDAAMRGATDDNQVKQIEESQCKRAEILVNVLHLNGDKPTIPQILQLTPTTFDKMLGYTEEYGDIHSLAEGTDFIIERTGTGLNTEYAVMAARKSEPVSASVMGGVVNLVDFVQQESEDGQRKAIAQVNAIIGVVEPADYAPKAIAAASPAKRLEKPVIEDVDMEVAEPKKAAPAKTVVDDAPFDTDLDELMAIDEELAATGTDGKAAPAKAAATSVDDLDALLGELDAL